jgi:hypothetical protein
MTHERPGQTEKHHIIVAGGDTVSLAERGLV